MKKRFSISNKKAYFNYEVISDEIAGIKLLGSEIKSIRDSKVSIKESYCYIREGEVFIKGMHIAEYKPSGVWNHDPLRARKLLLTKKQIRKYDQELQKKGLTLIPLSLFINSDGNAKIKLGLCKGKKNHDKRNSLKEKDQERDLQQTLKDY